MATVMIIGSGGREHALAWKLRQSPHVDEIFIAPGNGGTLQVGTNVSIQADDIETLAAFALAEQVDLTIVGPEVPLEAGIVDQFEKLNLPIFGPSQKAALLESSKAWASEFLRQYQIPHPRSQSFQDSESAISYTRTLAQRQIGFVIKASGLAAGKGVILPKTQKEAEDTIHQIMDERIFGNAGSEIVIQEKIAGQEVSVLALSDGNTVVPLIPAQDHKRIFDNDEGPNTGGMGAYAPTPFASEQDLLAIQESILQPVIDGMREQGTPYKGVLYAGLMMTESGPQVIEFNVRFGDPECQPIMMLLQSDLYELAQACINGTLQPEMVQFQPGAAICVVMAAEGYPGSYRKGDPIDQSEDTIDPDVQVFHAGTLRSTDGQIVTNGGRVLGITAWDETIGEAISKAYAAIDHGIVRFSGMQYRRDIGKKA